MEELISKLDSISINDDTNHIVKIQSWYRGCSFRMKRLPLIMYKLQKCLECNPITFSTTTQDGRVNSSLDEKEIVQRVVKTFGSRIVVSKDRMWYDILALDYIKGWIPINIKTTTTNSSDNVGNLATCLYAYTNAKMDLHSSYDNGKIHEILFKHLKTKSYSRNRDYYFIVLNKTDCKEVIINSIKGLSSLKHNINNLPYQVKWKVNKHFVYKSTEHAVQLYLECMKLTKPTWQEIYRFNMTTLYTT